MNREARTTAEATPGAETADAAPSRQMRVYPVRLHAASGHAWFARSARSHLDPIGRPTSSIPALLEAERLLASQRRSVGKRAVRSPADPSAPLRSHLPQPTGLRHLPATRGRSNGANDNAVAGFEPARISGRLREAFFLVLLAVLLIATFYLGTQNAFQNVIVIPEPWSTLSVLT